MREDTLYKAGEARVRDDYLLGNAVRVVALPHSCDQWKIGGPDQVRQLIADLSDLLARDAVPPLPDWYTESDD